MTERVKDALRKAPAATIVSVSQNDNSNYCKDPADMAIIQEEGADKRLFGAIFMLKAIDLFTKTGSGQA